MSTHYNQTNDQNNNIQTFFVSKNNDVTVICPACSSAKTFSVKQFRQHRFSIKARCSCMHKFTFKLDYRRSYRKSTNITGSYSIYSPIEDEGPAKVIDVSLKGICLETINSPSLRVGQKGFIDFTLDDKRKTRLKKEFAVRSINGNIFGCEFVQEQAYEKNLGFYLRPGL